MEEIPEEPSDAVLAEAWQAFALKYAEFGFRRKSFELFAIHLRKEFPRSTLSGKQIERRIHAYKKRLRTQRSRGD